MNYWIKKQELQNMLDAGILHEYTDDPVFYILEYDLDPTIKNEVSPK